MSYIQVCVYSEKNFSWNWIYSPISLSTEVNTIGLIFIKWKKNDCVEVIISEAHSPVMNFTVCLVLKNNLPQYSLIRLSWFSLLLRVFQFNWSIVVAADMFFLDQLSITSITNLKIPCIKWLNKKITASQTFKTPRRKVSF